MAGQSFSETSKRSKLPFDLSRSTTHTFVSSWIKYFARKDQLALCNGDLSTRKQSTALCLQPKCFALGFGRFGVALKRDFITSTAYALKNHAEAAAMPRR